MSAAVSSSPQVGAEVIPRATAITLVATGILTVLAGNGVAPTLPDIRDAFAGMPHIDLLARMVGTAHAAAVVATSPFTGPITRRLRPRNALISGLLMYILGGTSGAYLPNLYAILAGRFVLGVGLALTLTAALTVIGELYRGAVRSRILGRQSAAGSFGGLLLIAIGALAEHSWREAFCIYTVAVLIIVGALKSVPSDISKSGTGSTSMRLNFTPPLLRPLFAIYAAQVILSCVALQLPFLIQNVMAQSIFSSAVFIVVQTSVAGVVSALYHRLARRGRPDRLLVTAFAAIALGYLIVGMTISKIGLAVAMAMVGVGLGLLIPVINDWVLALAPARSRESFTAYVTAALFLGQFTAPFVTNPLVRACGIQTTFDVLAGCCALIAAGYTVGATAWTSSEG